MRTFPCHLFYYWWTHKFLASAINLSVICNIYYNFMKWSSLYNYLQLGNTMIMATISQCLQVMEGILMDKTKTTLICVAIDWMMVVRHWCSKCVFLFINILKNGPNGIFSWNIFWQLFNTLCYCNPLLVYSEDVLDFYLIKRYNVSVVD